MLGMTRGQIMIFLLTYAAVVARRASLESWSLLKADFQLDSHLPTVWLGVFDTCYLLSYSIGELINGQLSDRIKPSRFVSVGLLGAGLGLISMCVLGLFHWFAAPVFCALWIIEGYSQSAVYPGCVKIMGEIVPKHTRGRVMGLWTSNLNVGNIFGALFTSLFVGMGLFEWEHVIICLSLLMLGSAVSLATFDPAKNDGEEALLPRKKASLGEVLRFGGLAYYILGYSCVKFMNYAFMMWFPYYLFDSGEDKFTIGSIMVLYEVSGAFGAFLVGWVSDKIHSKIIPICVLLAIAAPTTMSILLFEAHFAGALAGFCNIAISNTVIGAVCLSIGRENIGAVSGVLDGCASLVAGLGMMLIGFLQGYGWNFVWELVFAVNLVAIVPFVLAKSKESLHQG